jgi:hypothetical protein
MKAVMAAFSSCTLRWTPRQQHAPVAPAGVASGQAAQMALTTHRLP